MAARGGMGGSFGLPRRGGTGGSSIGPGGSGIVVASTASMSPEGSAVGIAALGVSKIGSFGSVMTCTYHILGLTVTPAVTPVADALPPIV